jgi:hypothetical protein
MPPRFRLASAADHHDRPSLGPRKIGHARRLALAEARTRVESAATPADRARALCDAGDASGQTLGSPTSALGYYLRAMRTDPNSAEPVLRAARGLVRRPRALEKLLWRRLGGTPWEGPSRPAAVAALTELAAVYAGPLRNRSRASAISHALAALGQPLPTPPQSTPSLEAAADLSDLPKTTGG